MFSVVIPLYNKHLSIQNTINSVLNQTNQNFEIVVIDDGSTDDSADKVREIKDPRIRLIQQENQGVSAARNRGIQEAEFEWIALLDGDDLWDIHHLEEIENMMQQYPNEKVYVTSFEYSDNRPIYTYNHDKRIFKIDNYFKEALNVNLIWTSIVVIHKSCFDKIGLFNIKLSRGEDLDLWERLAKSFDIIKSNIVTATYRIESENRACEASNFNVYKSSVYHYDLHQHLTKEEFNYYTNRIINTCRTLIYNKDVKNFLRLYRKHHSHISILNILKLKK